MQFARTGAFDLGAGARPAEAAARWSTCRRGVHLGQFLVCPQQRLQPALAGQHLVIHRHQRHECGRHPQRGAQPLREPIQPGIGVCAKPQITQSVGVDRLDRTVALASGHPAGYPPP